MKKLLSCVLVAGSLLIGAIGVSATASGGSSDANKDLATVRKATAKYLDVQATDGLYTNTEHAASTPEGGMGIHFVNFSLLDDKINLTEPEALLYEVKNNGTHKLVGVEYVIEGKSITDFIPRLFGRDFDFMLNHNLNIEDYEPAEEVLAEIAPYLSNGKELPEELKEKVKNYHFDLHVWAWEANPNGMFYHWNPHVE